MTDTTETPPSAVAANPIDLAGLLKKLGHDELALFIPLLDAELTALQQPGANTQAVLQDAMKVKIEALAQVPAAESTGINDTAAAAQVSLHTILNQVATAATAPVAVPPVAEPVAAPVAAAPAAETVAGD